MITQKPTRRWYTSILSQRTLVFMGAIALLGVISGSILDHLHVPDTSASASQAWVWISILLCGGMAALIILLTYIAVIHPLNQVTQAIQSITVGQFDRRLPITGTREIAELADAFNRMADVLQAGQIETKDHLDEMHMLHAISLATSQTQEMDPILENLASRLALMFGASLVIIEQIDGNTGTHKQRASYNYDLTSEIQDPFCSVEPILLAMIAQSGQPLLIHDLIDLPGGFPSISPPPAFNFLLGLPLIANKQVIGMVLIANTQLQQPVAEYKIQVAMAAVGQIAAAISNIRLIEALAAERNRLNNIIDSVSDAIIVSDTDGRIQSANQAFTRVTGWDLEKMRGRFFWEVFAIPDDEIAPLRTEVSIKIKQEGVWRRELTGKFPGGSTYDVDVSFSAIRGPSGKIAGYVSSLRDITALKELDRMKNRFVSTVSHELRTPLSIINLYTENLIEFYSQLNDSKRQELLQDIHIETKTLHHLIEDLLILSRMDSDRAEPRRVEFNLGELLIELISSASRLAAEKNQELSYHLPDRPMQIFADWEQLGQVFRNLLSNAVKFTPIGGQIRVDVGLREQQVEVSIADTGMGIPKAEMPRLFERFYRSELSVQQEIPGTGLGLAISREIINRHQGAITVESELNKGSTFMVSLPMARTNKPTIVLIDDAPIV